jgi:hypothetical protein
MALLISQRFPDNYHMNHLSVIIYERVNFVDEMMQNSDNRANVLHLQAYVPNDEYSGLPYAKYQLC